MQLNITVLAKNIQLIPVKRKGIVGLPDCILYSGFQQITRKKYIAFKAAALFNLMFNI